MATNRLRKITAAVIAVVLLLLAGTACAGEKTGDMSILSWGELGHTQLQIVVDWKEEYYDMIAVDEDPTGKWAMAIFKVRASERIPAEEFYKMAQESLRLGDYTFGRITANGFATNEETGEIYFIDTIVFLFDVPLNFDSSFASLTAGGIKVYPTDGPYAAANIFDWGEYGRVQLTGISDWTEELAEIYMMPETPEGKWAVAIFSILDGGAWSTDAILAGRDIIQLSGYPVASQSVNGATYNPDTGEYKITGTIVYFFDVPEDFDVTQAAVTVNGTEVPLTGE